MGSEMCIRDRLGRYYERIADHAVAMGARTIYIVTGEAPEGENWPSSF